MTAPRSPAIALSSARIATCTSLASAGVAVFPVPIAHTGSYATITVTNAAAPTPASAARNWRVTTVIVSLASRCARVSPTQTVGVSPARKAATTFLPVSSSVSPNT